MTTFQALHHIPDDKKSLVWRSKAYSKLRKIRRAIDDVDAALHVDTLYKDVSSYVTAYNLRHSDYEDTYVRQQLVPWHLVELIRVLWNSDKPYGK